MGYYFDRIVYWVDGAYNQSWAWFFSLDQQQWLVVLGIATGLGFLCMRGFSSRIGY